jgi:phage gp29-like protein
MPAWLFALAMVAQSVVPFSGAIAATPRPALPALVAPAVSAKLSMARPRPGSSTPPIGQDARDIRSFDALIDHPGYSITPAGILAVFRQAEMGEPRAQCDLFDDLIEGDCHLRNLFEQRERGVAGKPWVVQADGTEPDSELGARVLDKALRRLPMLQTFLHLLTYNRYGYAAVEIDWGVTVIEGRTWIVPTWFAIVPARRFKIVTYNLTPGSSGTVDELRLYADVTRPQGDALRPDKWIVMRGQGRIARAGLMRTGAWPAMGKRLGFNDWIRYSQRFGIPLPIVRYDDNEREPDDDELAVAEECIRRIGSDAGAVMPKSLELEFHDATRGNQENSKAHGGLIAQANAEMSKLVNGSTLSNDSANNTGASYALGQVHDEVRWDNVVFDAEALQEAIETQLFEPFWRFNNLGGSRPNLFIQVVRSLDPKTRIECAKTMVVDLGIKVSKAQLMRDAGYQEPRNDEDAVVGAPQPAPGRVAA